MSAAARNPRLELVRGPDSPAGHDRDTEAVAPQWEPEHQLVGALMWLPAGSVRPILELVPDTAIARPLTRWAYEIIRSVVHAGTDPNPVVILAAAKRQAARDALQPDRPPTGEQLRRFAMYLHDAYRDTVSPTAAPTFAREVHDDAYRRAFREQGIRMQQLGECDAKG